MKFEAHITIDKAYGPTVKAWAEEDKFKGWQYSAIDDDPIMGQKPYCYLTAYNPYVKALRSSMEGVVTQLKDEGIEALRMKIERIVYDSKTGWNEIL